MVIEVLFKEKRRMDLKADESFEDNNGEIYWNDKFYRLVGKVKSKIFELYVFSLR